MNPNFHKAQYDENGNIILPSEDSGPTGEYSNEGEWNWSKNKTVWNTIEEEKPELIKKEANHGIFESKPAKTRLSRSVNKPKQQKSKKEIKNPFPHIKKKIKSSTKDIISEGAHQYKFSLKSAGKSILNSKKHIKHGAKHTWIFMMQPVWVPRRNKDLKEYSRLSLFLVDTVKFGGTFAAIFVALFVSLNYQSFWSIVTTHLNPVEYVRNVHALTASVDSTLREKLLKSPSLAVSGSNDGNLLSFLPSIGPPENRIIIPKMGLNIPLVTPAYDSLLREDWEQVETDIQDALQMGVVHYPGTAKPGQAGNFFVTGHSSYYPWAPGKYKNIFARLHELVPGDEYWVYYGGDKHRYIVRSKREVKPSDVTVLDQPIDRRVATLMTCTPVGTTLRRLVIASEEVDPQTGIVMQVGAKVHNTMPAMKAGALPI
ncbi:class E sortase [Patescibacteria group bacterium]|nr:class E sortase [Patescibacteria group bacterium]MBU1123244.1 class E sortase [Patescibacteria group bacterium]MBU1911617.1 class E sortase [Patescibacteria group bacterium]